jgi:hypothetical protein
VPLNNDEKSEIKDSFLRELQQEHHQRERRVEKKSQKQSSIRTFAKERKANEVASYKSEVRREFYEEHGYRLQKDRTGRDMWLSPAEQDHQKKRRKGNRKKNKYEALFQKGGKPILMYAAIAVFAFLVGLLVSKN